jgi:argininosuccinate lyase
MRFKVMKKSSPVSRSGRFAYGPAAEVARFTQSISYDWRLWRQDILGSKAHAAMLQKVGLLSRAELDSILKGLDAISAEIEAGTFLWKPELEDVHMNIEMELTRRVAAGAKLHTGRSRNDQVASDVRLWLRDQIGGMLTEISELQSAFLALAKREAEVVMPGYTHLQRAQPVYFAHHLLAYLEMLERDSERLRDCLRRVNVSTLGAGALAGSTLPLDRIFVARQLGFVDGRGHPQIAQNSMDAVSDRDFVVEFCSDAALVAVHLSRLAEDLVVWASSEFGFIRLSDAYTTGSSLMPQKKNPDVAELMRAKSARVIGNVAATLALLKGLPMSYNRDLQEDKERLFDTADTVRATLRICTGLLRNVIVNRAGCEAAAADPALLATDLAEYLVRKGVPFRKAHHAVGSIVLLAEQLGKGLDELSLPELRSVEAGFEADALEVFNLKQALSRRNLPGAPSAKEVGKQLDRWTRLLCRRSRRAPNNRSSKREA